MRSEQVHRAMARGLTHDEICQLVSKGVRVTHKPGTRFEDSIGNVLDHLSVHKGSLRRIPTSALPQTAMVAPAA
jgi:hypothetical protein